MTRPTSSSRPASAARKKTVKPLGSVAFVGAGPGDPQLLTVRAVELLAKADVVVTESQDAEFVRRYCREGVEVVDGSLGDDGQPLSHAVRARLVAKAAKGGGLVVRLLDGDPFLYATGSEEAAACAKAGIPFEVVPGVSSITAVPAYAGIPLTSAKHREVRVVNVAEGSVDWSDLGAGTATLVLLAATAVMGDVAKSLIAAGRAPETPVALTQSGTTTAQRTVVSTLERVAADIKAAKLAPPTITVVGDTVGLRDSLSWFETKPLFGWRVLVPRTKEQAGALSDRLRAFGAVSEEVPTIAVEPPRTPQQMERAIKGLVTGRYEWIALTSRNAVKAVRERFEEYGLDARAFAGIKVAAVGEQTAADLLAWGIKPDLVPSGEQSAAGLLEDWPPYDPVFDPIDRVFLPRADIATENLVAGLVERGWEVDDVTAYRTVRAAPPAAPIREAIKSGGYDAVVFTSSSTVRNLVGIAGKPHPSTVIACIGPATAKTAEEHGLRVDVLAPSPSVADLACALSEYGATLRASAVAAGEPVLRPSQKRTTARRKAT
ncbi:MAG TPA: bifunctional uroporphyrinogen-III C-methyltransferase/uroporphyrinogen-III synthase [Actinomycetes bacterium]|nr:bifunctional uroporphyrinogen-III C-methyltransferase/uroporphyrinogen-III synthase [Actinomycetes bacterium]